MQSITSIFIFVSLIFQSFENRSDFPRTGHEEFNCIENFKPYSFFIFSVKRVDFCYPEHLESSKINALNIFKDSKSGSTFYATDLPDFYSNQTIIQAEEKDFSEKLRASGNKKVKFIGSKVVVIEKKYNSLFSEGTYFRDGVKHFICQYSFLSKYNDIGPIITFWLVNSNQSTYENDKAILLKMIESSSIASLQ